MRLESTVAASLDAIRAELARTRISASTMNFVVWIDDRTRRDWIIERAEMLGEKHPSFTLIFDTTAECEEATVITSDRDVLEHFTVQGERVIVDARTLDPREIEEYVTALCPTTVPTVLWWSGNDVGDAGAFHALLHHAQKLVVDSSGGTRDVSTIASLAAFHAHHPEIELRDLAFMRLRPWQDMIAQFFDDPALLEELFSIGAMRVGSGSDAEAFYLAGWLASRLGWTAAGRDRFRDPRGNPIAFACSREGDIRRVTRVCLDSRTSWYHGEITEDPAVVRVWVEGEHARPEILFTLSAIDNASLLERAVLETGTDEVFVTALRSAGTLLG